MCVYSETLCVGNYTTVGGPLHVVLMGLVCVTHMLPVPQILEKVSPNPREVKAVAAHSNAKKNRSMEFLPGMSVIREKC